MTMTADLVGRAAACRQAPAEIPSTERRFEEVVHGAELRVATVKRDGRDAFHFHGCASTVEQPYEMYDFWGPYTEIIDRDAFATTLAASPDVAFLLNHRGLSMARTKSGTLELSISDEGLIVDAYCNADRADVRDMAMAIEDGDIDQMSFAFRIVRGAWSPDYTEYRILEVDLDRGDVSAVNFGANPNTSIAARSKQALAALDGDLPVAVLRELAQRSEARLMGVVDNTADTTIIDEPAPVQMPDVRSMTYAEALLRNELG